MILIFVWFTSFSMIISRSSMLLQMALFHSRFNNWVIFHFIYIHHTFIHLSVSGLSGCFHVMAILNCAAVNIVYLFRCVFCGYMPRNEIPGSYENSILNFLKNFHTVLLVAAPTCIPTNSVRGFLFLQISPAFIICRPFDEAHSDHCEVISHCSFDLHFSND